MMNSTAEITGELKAVRKEPHRVLAYKLMALVAILMLFGFNVLFWIDYLKLRHQAASMEQNIATNQAMILKSSDLMAGLQKLMINHDNYRTELRQRAAADPKCIRCHTQPIREHEGR